MTPLPEAETSGVVSVASANKPSRNQMWALLRIALAKE
jgi:hypothetical protein